MARDFNGSTDRLDWNNIANTVSALSVSAWVYIDAVAHTSYVFCSHNVDNTTFAEIFGFSYVNATTTAVFMNGLTSTVALQRASNSITTSTLAGAWHHILFAWDGSLTAANCDIYLDGTEVSYATTTNGTGTLEPGTGKWSIGARLYDDNRNFDGKIAEIAVWNRALAAGEIAALAGGSAPSLIGTNLLYYYSAKTDTTTAETGGAAATVDGTSYSAGHPTINYGNPRYYRMFLQGV